MKELLDAGQSPGLIALVGERAVGWCAVGPLETYPQYEPVPGRCAAWAIPCLYVDPQVERASVARALIEAAASLASTNAADVVEGPPPYWFAGGAKEVADATSAFLENGFERVGAGARMPALRRVLRNEE